MTRHAFPRLTAAAVSLSLALLAGCASPVVPSVPGPTGDGQAPAPPAPAVPGASAPSGPAPSAPAAPLTLAGVATFHQAPTAGYAVQVYDAQTGEPVPAIADLTAATGLAVSNERLVTGPDGRFSVTVANVAPGRALRIVVSAGAGSLETVVLGSGRVLGAGRLLAAEAVPVNALTTALSHIARGVLLSTRTLSPEAAAAIVDQLFTELAALAPQLDAALQRTPAFANRLAAVRPARPLDAHAAAEVTALVREAGALKPTTEAVARLIGALSRAADDPTKRIGLDPADGAALARLELAGTVLASTFDGQNGFGLVNTLTGQVVDASSPDVGAIAAVVSRPSGGGSRGPSVGPVDPAPTAPVLSALSQPAGSVGTVLTLTGSGFSPTASENTVSFNGVTATPVSADETRLRVAVPAGAIDGGVTVTVGGLTTAGQAFDVRDAGAILAEIATGAEPWDVAVDDQDRVWVSEAGTGNVIAVSGDAVTTTLAVGSMPRSLTRGGPGEVWVSANGAIRPISGGVVGEAIALGDWPNRLARDTAGRIWGSGSAAVYEVAGGAATTHGGLFFGYFGLAGDSLGNMWAAEGGSTVLRFHADAGRDPRYDEVRVRDGNGLDQQVYSLATAADGGLWAASQAGYVFRLVDGVAQPGVWLDPDYTSGDLDLEVAADGSVWAASAGRGRVYHLADGVVRTTVSGLAGARALAVDGAGNVWVVATDANKLYKLAP